MEHANPNLGLNNDSSFARWTCVLRVFLVILAALCSLACANLLGIDEPSPAPGSAGGAGAGAAGGATDTADAATAGAAGERAQAGDGGSPDLIISGSLKPKPCGALEVETTLTASGGREPYTWSPVGDEPEFRLVPSEIGTAQTILVGSLAARNKITWTVRVTDANGATGERTFVATPTTTPTIETPILPSVCPNEVYSVPLKASGGDPSSYRWTTDLPETTGLVIEDAKSSLAGTFKATSDTRPLSFTLYLTDGDGCAAKPVALSLQPEYGATVCAQIVVKGQPAGSALPAACAGSEYRQELGVVGAAGAYSWQVVGKPSPGLELDAKGTLSGTIAISGADVGTLTVKAQNADSERWFEHSFDLKQREKCWFAYLAKGTELQQLNLFDPVLGKSKSLAARPDEAVLSFKFSPSGEYIAYTVAAQGADASLVIVRLKDWAEQRFTSFAGLTRYEWSPDSRFLAAACSTKDGNSLRLVATAAPIVGSSGNTSLLTFPVYPALDLDVAVLTWANSGQLAFFGRPDALDPDSWSLGLSTVDADGIHTPQIYAQFFGPGDFLHPATSGIFGVSAYINKWFYDVGLPVGSPHAYDAVIAPSGRFVARIEQHQLELFRANEISIKDASNKSLGCDTILAWASRTERIVCKRDEGTAQSRLTFFDVDSDGGKLTPFADTAVALSGGIAPGRRLMTSDGTRLAFVMDASLNVVTFDGSASKLIYSVPLTSSDSKFAELAFSPDQKLVLQHRGTRLSAFDLQADVQHEFTLAEDLAVSEACTEDPVDDTASWCGSLPSRPSLHWTPDGRFVAYQNADGTTRIGDLSAAHSGTFTPIEPDPACGRGCIAPGQFAFQP
jgi:WD40 repeat protein